MSQMIQLYLCLQGCRTSNLLAISFVWYDILKYLFVGTIVPLDLWCDLDFPCLQEINSLYWCSLTALKHMSHFCTGTCFSRASAHEHMDAVGFHVLFLFSHSPQCVCFSRWSGWCTGLCLHCSQQQKLPQTCSYHGESTLPHFIRDSQLCYIDPLYLKPIGWMHSWLNDVLNVHGVFNTTISYIIIVLIMPKLGTVA